MDDCYTKTLADLHAKKREIDQAIASLETIRRWGAPAPAALAPPKEPEGAVEQKSLMDAIIDVLQECGSIMSPAEIVTELEDSGFEIRGLDKHRNVGATLNRGKNSGVLVNPERGQWGLAEWGLTAASEPEQRAGLPLSAPPASSETL